MYKYTTPILSGGWCHYLINMRYTDIYQVAGPTIHCPSLYHTPAGPTHTLPGLAGQLTLEPFPHKPLLPWQASLTSFPLLSYLLSGVRNLFQINETQLPGAAQHPASSNPLLLRSKCAPQSQAAHSHSSVRRCWSPSKSTARGPWAEDRAGRHPSLACAVVTQPTLAPPWRPRSTPQSTRAGFRL